MTPCNILINKHGEIKLCDFDIAGELVNSFLATGNDFIPYVYFAPERINPMQIEAKYDQRSDVWSYGITMVSLSNDSLFVLIINIHMYKSPCYCDRVR